MPISEHDRQVLAELEEELRTASQRRVVPSAGRRHSRGRPGRLFLSLAGLPVALLVVFVGLRLNSPAGTCVGVAGSLLVLAGVAVAVDTASPWWRSRMDAARRGSTPR